MSSPGLTDEATHFFYAEVENLRPVSKAVTDGGITRGWWLVPLKIEVFNSFIKSRHMIPSLQKMPLWGLIFC